MKRFIKICLIAGSVCVLIGGGISAVAAVLGGNLWDIVPQRALEWRREISGVTLDGFWDEVDFVNFDLSIPEVFNKGEKGQEIFSSAKVKKMDIVIRTGNVVFEENPQGSEVKIFCNRDQSCYTLYAEDDDLELQEYDGWKRKDGPELLFTVQVPKNYRFSEVDLQSVHSNLFSGSEDFGPAMTSQALSADELTIETKAGVIKINGGSVGNLQVKSSAGAVEFLGRTTGDIEAICQAGTIRLELAGKKEDYNYDIQCKMGAVKVGDEGTAALQGKKQTDNGAGKDMDLDCRTGAIQVDFMNEL
ncbi:protein of unknown function (DUF4098) [Clostridium sp. ASBs410]|jgi:hypothetical protein|nr:protein of unknown function (DUF4098) [Clostridium sp. ASBs410]